MEAWDCGKRRNIQVLRPIHDWSRVKLRNWNCIPPANQSYKDCVIVHNDSPPATKSTNDRDVVLDDGLHVQ